MNGLVQDLGVMGGSGLAKDDTRAVKRIASALDSPSVDGALIQPTSVAVASPVFGRTISSSLMEVGAAVSVMAFSEQEWQKNLKSKSVAWKDPVILLQRVGSLTPGYVKGKSPGKARQQQQESTKQKLVDEFQRPSRWFRFLRLLGIDGSRKVHAARGDWLNYDAQSYAMNFEKDSEALAGLSSQQLPRISGPGAREIVTVILRRSPSTNRNGGFALLPKPVLIVQKQPANPLWKRRSVEAPASLDLKSLGRKKGRSGNASAHVAA